MSLYKIIRNDEICHSKGFKYIDRIPTHYGYRYVYEEQEKERKRKQKNTIAGNSTTMQLQKHADVSKVSSDTQKLKDRFNDPNSERMYNIYDRLQTGYDRINKRNMNNKYFEEKYGNNKGNGLKTISGNTVDPKSQTKSTYYDPDVDYIKERSKNILTDLAFDEVRSMHYYTNAASVLRNNTKFLTKANPKQIKNITYKLAGLMAAWHVGPEDLDHCEIKGNEITMILKPDGYKVKTEYGTAEANEKKEKFPNGR